MPGSFIQHADASSPPLSPVQLKTLKLMLPPNNDKALLDDNLKKLQDRAMTQCGQYTKRSRFGLFNMPRFGDAKQIIAHITKTNKETIDPLEKTMHLMAYVNCKLHEYMRDNLDIDMSKLPDPIESQGQGYVEPVATDAATCEEEIENGQDQHEPSVMAQLAQLPATATVKKSSDHYYNLLMDIINSQDYQKCAQEIIKDKKAQAKYEALARTYLVEHNLLGKDEKPDRRFYYA